MKEFLFITGCPRSGTSALVQLLSGSSDIVLGMERYGHLVQPRSFSLTQEHFEKSRFFEIKEGDTFYKDFDHFHQFDPHIREKFDNAIYVGDKRPDLYEAYSQIFNTFKSAKLLYIYRDIKEVASSYHGRIKRGDNWPSSKDFSSAVQEWNRSLYLTREQLKDNPNIAIVNYHNLFLTDTSIQPIADFLGIPVSDSWQQHLVRIRQRASELELKRENLLDESQLKFIEENAKEFLVNDLQQARII